jgi:hypothetical protein
MERGFLLLPWCATLCALGAAALAAGCGEPDPVDDKDGSLRLELTEYALDPQVVKTSSRSIRIQARNRGRLTHNVTVQEEREGEGAQARPRVLGSTPTAQPGETVRTQRPIRLAPGRYRLACTIGNHDTLGEYGTLIVTR